MRRGEAIIGALGLAFHESSDVGLLMLSLSSALIKLLFIGRGEAIIGALGTKEVPPPHDNPILCSQGRGERIDCPLHDSSDVDRFMMSTSFAIKVS